jgi:hypothetical protein
MQRCQECGGTRGELGKGSDAYASEHPDGIENPCIIVYCPPCAAAEFGDRPAAAENDVCAWYPAFAPIPPARG